MFILMQSLFFQVPEGDSNGDQLYRQQGLKFQGKTGWITLRKCAI